MSIVVVESWILMEVVDLSSVLMLARLDTLFISPLDIHALYDALS